MVWEAIQPCCLGKLVITYLAFYVITWTDVIKALRNKDLLVRWDTRAEIGSNISLSLWILLFTYLFIF